MNNDKEIFDALELLETWLKSYEQQQKCKYCSIDNYQCDKHLKLKEKFDKLAAKTRKLLGSQPN